MIGVWIGGAFVATAVFGWQMAVLTIGLVVALLLIRRRRHDLPVALLVAGVAIIGAARSMPPTSVESPPWVDEATALKGRIDSAPTSTGRSQSFRLAVTEAEIDDRWVPATGSVCVAGSPRPFAALADQVLVVGTARPLGDLDRATQGYLRGRACGASLVARSLSVLGPGIGWRRDAAVLRDRLNRVLRRAAPGDSGALLSGLVTGDDHRLTSARQEAFRRSGTTHITAVSGANVALVVTVLVALGSAGGIRRRTAWLLVVVLAVWGYAALVGGEPPVIRAALVASGAIMAIRFGRRPDVLTLLALAAVVMAAIEPAQLWRLSFQLSFAASLGIVLALSGFNGGTLLSGLAAALSATLAAQVATLPMLWLAIGEVSLTALPANLLIAPLVGIAFPLAALAGGLGLLWEPLAVAVALPARLCAELVFVVVDALGGAPLAVTTVGESSPLVAMLLTGLATVAVLTMSPDTRRWMLRQRTRWHR